MSKTNVGAAPTPGAARTTTTPMQVVPIRQDELSGALSLIFSAERELSEAERTIVQEFTRVFRPGREVEPAEWPQAAEKVI